MRREVNKRSVCVFRLFWECLKDPAAFLNAQFRGRRERGRSGRVEEMRESGEVEAAEFLGEIVEEVLAIFGGLHGLLKCGFCGGDVTRGESLHDGQDRVQRCSGGADAL